MSKKAQEKCQEINSALTIYDFDSNKYVVVETDEGLRLTLPSAFVLKWNNWYLVFAEHHVPLYFDKDDVTAIYEYTVTRHEDQIPTADSHVPVKPHHDRTLVI